MVSRIYQEMDEVSVVLGCLRKKRSQALSDSSFYPPEYPIQDMFIMGAQEVRGEWMNGCLYKPKGSRLKAKCEVLIKSLGLSALGGLMHPLLSRSIYNAAAWYYHHCQDRMPIVMVTEDEEAIQQYGSETEGVFVISFKVFPAGVCVCVCSLPQWCS